MPLSKQDVLAHVLAPSIHNSQLIESDVLLTLQKCGVIVPALDRGACLNFTLIFLVAILTLFEVSAHAIKPSEPSQPSKPSQPTHPTQPAARSQLSGEVLEGFIQFLELQFPSDVDVFPTIESRYEMWPGLLQAIDGLNVLLAKTRNESTWKQRYTDGIQIADLVTVLKSTGQGLEKFLHLHAIATDQQYTSAVVNNAFKEAQALSKIDPDAALILYEEIINFSKKSPRREKQQILTWWNMVFSAAFDQGDAEFLSESLDWVIQEESRKFLNGKSNFSRIADPHTHVAEIDSIGCLQTWLKAHKPQWHTWFSDFQCQQAFRNSPPPTTSL